MVLQFYGDKDIQFTKTEELKREFDRIRELNREIISKADLSEFH